MRAIINQLGLIAQIMGGSLLALGLNLVLARSLPLAEYGAYMLAMSIASITCWGALCGYDVLASRHAQEWKDDPRMRSAFVLAGHSMIAMASLAMAAITWSVWFIFYQQVLAPEAVMLVCLITLFWPAPAFCCNTNRSGASPTGTCSGTFSTRRPAAHRFTDCRALRNEPWLVRFPAGTCLPRGWCGDDCYGPAGPENGICTVS